MPPLRWSVQLASLLLASQVAGCGFSSTTNPPSATEPRGSAAPTPTPIPLSRVVGWSAGPGMSAPRAMDAAIRLADGRVLIVGSQSRPITTGELYDPVTDSFTATAPLAGRPVSVVLTLMPDGRVLVAGGDRHNAELYDPATGAWSLTASMVGKRRGHPEVLLKDGRVLAIGGDIDSIASKTVEVFDPQANTWTAAASLSGGRIGHTASLLGDGRVLVAGGQASWNGNAPMDTVEIYDPSTGMFAIGPSMSHPRSWHTATVLADGTVLVVGGSQGYEVLQTAEVFDPVADTWSDVASTSDFHTSHTATLLPGGRVLVTGGYTASAEVYEPGTGRWLPAGNMASDRIYHTATLLLDGRVLIAGGIDGENVTLASTELWLAGPAL